MITTSTSTSVVTVIVVLPLEAADVVALLFATLGSTRRHSGLRRGPERTVLAEVACGTLTAACGALTPT